MKSYLKVFSGVFWLLAVVLLTASIFIVALVYRVFRLARQLIVVPRISLGKSI